MDSSSIRKYSRVIHTDQNTKQDEGAAPEELHGEYPILEPRQYRAALGEEEGGEEDSTEDEHGNDPPVIPREKDAAEAERHGPRGEGTAREDGAQPVHRLALLNKGEVLVAVEVRDKEQHHWDEGRRHGKIDVEALLWTAMLAD